MAYALIDIRLLEGPPVKYGQMQSYELGGKVREWLTGFGAEILDMYDDVEE